ncbi:MAG TPA: Na+/H+ antiporter subunit E [Steroidobacteraceae bacterium]|nr:Na+/H+ antiporter subunit E [Steroidobacteraceae bacterium]HRX90857.1 Na+/H+ antiporter subunit E [Steroidobacteraceae bacterium]
MRVVGKFGVRWALLLIVLVVVWLLWSGIYTPLLLGLGAFSCVLSVFIAHRVGFFGRDVFSLHLMPRLPRYWGWLTIEVVKSSIDVARIVLQPRMPISPTVVTFHATSSRPVAQAILGNSITLTPGTVTLDIHDGKLQVHCLTKAGAAALLEGEFDRRATALVKD